MVDCDAFGKRTCYPITLGFQEQSLLSMKTIACGLLLAFGISIVTSAWGLEPSDPVENFALLDHRGAAHELYYYSDAKAVVLMVQGNGCPISQNAWLRFRKLRNEYAKQGIPFMLINSNLQDHRASIHREADELGIDLPILIDETQVIGESLGLSQVGEVLIVDPKNWTLVYRGAIDDRVAYETQEATVDRRYLKEALDDLLAGNAVRTVRTDAAGCLISFLHRQKDLHSQISYSEEIAPILKDKCVTCHRPGGIGPWAMTSYNMVRGFAPMIREVIRTRRMPPWHADPAYGRFKNDRSLSAKEIRTLVHWVEAGAPRGKGPDPLETLEYIYPEWQLGEPDLVIEIPPTEIPETGIVEYQHHSVENPLDEHKWVQATEVVPGDPAALHHMFFWHGLMAAEKSGRKRLQEEEREQLGVYLPGQWQDSYAPDAGALLPADSVFEFEMHYTAYGKATVDRSRVGIYFRDTPPRHHLQLAKFINQRIKIPPHAKNYRETAEQIFTWGDVLIFGLHSHSHYRGKAASFVAHYPDGTTETLLSVPNYDFNWQTSYQLEKPKFLPAGTRVVYTTWWDNSAQNPANPDPTREVLWGLRTMDEMLYGTIRFSYIDSAY